uniref:Methyltransferase NSUN5 n=1 Tax=Lepeophtheirus salmonis TaxID=72036 RepID=C1BUQ1_LEPSM|nr:methyltransferase NSUN5 [Lepeophtheirus salmonis]
MEPSAFRHSVRVPRLYKVASHIYEDHINGKGTIKNLIHNTKRHPNIGALLSLVTECVAKRDEITELLKKSKLFEEEPRFNKNLASILITELIWGKGKLPATSRPLEIMLKRQKQLKALSKELCFSQKVKIVKPRWARVNTFKISFDDALKHFVEMDGLNYLEYDQDTKYQDFLEKVRLLEPYEFMCDLHVDNLLVFHPKTAFYSHELYLNGSIILQDKASTLPIQALNVKEGSIVMDACAAPGNKTTQIASCVGLNGGVYAIERDEERIQILDQTLERAGIHKSLVKVCNIDFTTLNPDDSPDVEYIVLDPSCSSSGILSDVAIGNRLSKLSAFQFKMLEHALKFPNVSKISYSTCSVHKIENEEVIEAIVKKHPHFKVQHVLKKWPTRGLNEYPHGDKFVRATFETDLCSGFFVAILKRIKMKKMNRKED